jgi:hypothetical protein
MHRHEAEAGSAIPAIVSPEKVPLISGMERTRYNRPNFVVMY